MFSFPGYPTRKPQWTIYCEPTEVGEWEASVEEKQNKTKLISPWRAGVGGRNGRRQFLKWEPHPLWMVYEPCIRNWRSASPWAHSPQLAVGHTQSFTKQTRGNKPLPRVPSAGWTEFQFCLLVKEHQTVYKGNAAPLWLLTGRHSDCPRRTQGNVSGDESGKTILTEAATAHPGSSARFRHTEGLSRIFWLHAHLE